MTFGLWVVSLCLTRVLLHPLCTWITGSLVEMLFLNQSVWGRELENLQLSPAPTRYRGAAGSWSTLWRAKASDSRAYSWLPAPADLLTEAYKGGNNRRRGIQKVAEGRAIRCRVIGSQTHLPNMGHLGSLQNNCAWVPPLDILGCSLDIEIFRSSPWDSTE